MQVSCRGEAAAALSLETAPTQPNPTPDVMKTLFLLPLIMVSIALIPVECISAAEAPKCALTGKPANPAIATNYEGETYVFCDEASRDAWLKARKASLYERLGGKAAIDAVVDAFYVRMLKDARVKHFFEDINMSAQRRKQKAFLSAAFGGPKPWSGKDMRRAHENLSLTEGDFHAVAENLQATLVDAKVPAALVAEVMTIAASTKDAVLNRKPSKP